MPLAKNKPEGMSKEGREKWWKLVEDCTLQNPGARPTMPMVASILNIILNVVQGFVSLLLFIYLLLIVQRTKEGEQLLSQKNESIEEKVDKVKDYLEEKKEEIKEKFEFAHKDMATGMIIFH